MSGALAGQTGWRSVSAILVDALGPGHNPAIVVAINLLCAFEGDLIAATHDGEPR